MYLRPPLKGFPGTLGQKTRMTELPGRTRSLTISSAVWLQSTNVTEDKTDGHRTTAKTALTHSVARLQVMCLFNFHCPFTFAYFLFPRFYGHPPGGHGSGTRMSPFWTLLPRDAMRKRSVARCPSVCTSTCLSRWSIISTRLKISSSFFLGPVVTSF